MQRLLRLLLVFWHSIFLPRFGILIRIVPFFITIVASNLKAVFATKTNPTSWVKYVNSSFGVDFPLVCPAS